MKHEKDITAPGLLTVLTNLEPNSVEAVFREVADLRATAPKSLRAKVDECLKQQTFRGARWDKAGSRAQGRALAGTAMTDLLQGNTELARICLEIWANRHKAELEKVRKMLAQRGKALCPEGPVPPEWRGVDEGEFNEWAKEMEQTDPTLKEDQWRLLVALGSGAYPEAGDAPGEEEAEVEWLEAPWNLEAVPWNDLEEYLEEVPSGAEGWERASGFSAAVVRIAQTKRAQQEATAELRERLQTLHGRMVELKDYGPDWPDVTNWAAIEFKGAEVILEALERANRLAGELSELRTQPATLTADKAKIRKAEELGQALAKLESMRRSAPTPPEGDGGADEGGRGCHEPEEEPESVEGGRSEMGSVEASNGRGAEADLGKEEGEVAPGGEGVEAAEAGLDTRGGAQSREQAEESRTEMMTPSAEEACQAAAEAEAGRLEEVAPREEANQSAGEVEVEQEKPRQAEAETQEEASRAAGTVEAEQQRPQPLEARSRDGREELLMRLLARGRYGLVYHVAKRLEESLGDSPVPSQLAHAMAFHRYLCKPEGLVSRVVPDLDSIAVWVAIKETEEAGLAGAVAGMRIALLGGGASAEQLLEECARHVANYPQIRSLIVWLADRAGKGTVLTPEQVQGVKGQIAAEAVVQSRSEEIRRWLEKNENPNMQFARASEVLRSCLAAGGALDELLGPAAGNEEGRARATLIQARKLEDLKTIHRTIHDVDAENGHAGAYPISGAAFNRLVDKFKEAVGLAKEWATLSVARDSGAGRDEFTAELLDELRKRVEPARAEAERMEGESGISASVIEALEGLEDFHNPAKPLATEEPDEFAVLGRDWLLTGAVSLDEELKPILEDDAGGLMRLLEREDREPLTWRTASASHAEAGDFRSVRLLQELAAKEGWAAAEKEDVGERIEEGLRIRRKRFSRRLGDAKKMVEAAVAQSLIDEGQRDEYARQLESLGATIESTEDFREEEKRLSRILEPLDELRAGYVAATKRRLDRMETDRPGKAQYGRIRGLLASKSLVDAQAAGELLDMVERNESDLDQSANLDVFEEFVTRQIEVLGRTELPWLQQALRQEKKVEGLPAVSEMTAEQREMSREALHQWSGLKDLGGLTQAGRQEELRKLLAFLGWAAPRISAFEERNKLHSTVLTVKTPPCPIPAWGSEASDLFGDARFGLHLAHGRLSVGEVVRAVKARQDRRPAVVLYLGRMDLIARRQLASQVRRDRLPLLVVDEIAMMRLALEPPPRIETFFRLLLPFSFATPYTTRGGYVAREMFFGRRKEIEDLLDFRGPCLVYGGRQLGKTALLKEARARFDSEREEERAIFLDLDNEARLFAGQGDIDRIWRHLAMKSREAGIAVEAENPSGEALLGYYRKWLMAKPTRKLLVLLDECDEFLEKDAGESFPRLKMFKALMESEEVSHRFKVVFCGLHNVQKVNRDPNNPLTHLGPGICVGPLLANGEWREARRLIEQPLQALGYRMTEREPVWAILSRTNYYPKLIQVACTHLLEGVLQPANHERYDARVTPPYAVTKEDVELALEDPNLHKKIREDFQRTLELDHRYHVIAYGVAHHAVERRVSLFEGMHWKEILETARDWYPSKIGDKGTDHSFRVLLDEMVGLGVLKELPDGRYGLRSPQLLPFLGTPNEIEAELQKTPIEKYHYRAEDYRERVDSKGERSRWAPLTAKQMTMVKQEAHGVSVILGSRNLGLTETATYLEHVYGEANTHYSAAKGVAEFEQEMLKRVDRSYTAPTAMIVADEVNWTVDWVKAAVARTEKAHSKAGYLHYIFLAGPRKTLEWVRLRKKDLPVEGTKSYFREVALEPWLPEMLEQWLREQQIAHFADEAAGVVEKTRLWPVLIAELGERVRSRTFKEALEQVGSDIERFRAGSGCADVLEAEQYLSLVATGGPLRDEDLALAEELVQEGGTGLATWAKLMRLVREVDGRPGHWEVDRVIREALKLNAKVSSGA